MRSNETLPYYIKPWKLSKMNKYRIAKPIVPLTCILKGHGLFRQILKSTLIEITFETNASCYTDRQLIYKTVSRSSISIHVYIIKLN